VCGAVSGRLPVRQAGREGGREAEELTASTHDVHVPTFDILRNSRIEHSRKLWNPSCRYVLLRLCAAPPFILRFLDEDNLIHCISVKLHLS